MSFENLLTTEKEKKIMLDYIAFGKEVISKEANGLRAMIDSLDMDFSLLCAAIINSPGKVVVSGVGKAGIIGKKISATMASTGTPSIYLDPLDALHGDLGIVGDSDLVLLLSNSGTSDEILMLAHVLRGRKLKVCCFSKTNDTPLSKLCDLSIAIGTQEEACPLHLAPSTSTTKMLALGDALALTIMKFKGFRMQDYARLHPAGALGRQLRRLYDCMRPLQEIATATPETPILEAIQRISERKTGICVVVDKENSLLGVFTDGDFRRIWQTKRDIYEVPISEVYTTPCHKINENSLAKDALEYMSKIEIAAMPVVNDLEKVVGLITLRDIY